MGSMRRSMPRVHKDAHGPVADEIHEVRQGQAARGGGPAVAGGPSGRIGPGPVAPRDRPLRAALGGAGGGSRWGDTSLLREGSRPRTLSVRALRRFPGAEPSPRAVRDAIAPGPVERSRPRDARIPPSEEKAPTPELLRIGAPDRDRPSA